jgi:S-adenosylmethionine/arginine decarboxylase-like enzyme
MGSFSKFLQEDALGIKAVSRENYGQELILDIHKVPSEFFIKNIIRNFAEKLCDEIKMKRGPIYIWGENKELRTAKKGEGPIKADGFSCVQFIEKSSITIHALDEIQKVFINIFSCDPFDVKTAINFVKENVGGNIVRNKNIIRH